MPNPIDEHRADFEQVLEHFFKELQGMRTGRASIALVESISVEVYGGQRMELKALASMTTPDAKTIQLEPWDKSVVKEIEKALINASLGMQPNVAGTVIRLVMPPLTEEGRKNLVKVLHQKAEAAKIGLRNIREKLKTAISEDEKQKRISEDEKRRQLEKLDKVVGEWNAKIESESQKKEQEIMTV